MNPLYIDLFKESKAVIFDMDGLVVNSEPFWHIAEIEVFKTLGIELELENCLETTGLPIENVIEYWYAKHPWPNFEPINTKIELVEIVMKLIKQEAKAMPGVYALLEELSKSDFKIGMASASPIVMIEEVLEKLNIKHFFDFYHSAELEKNNKPHPDVYFTVANKLNVSIQDCIILEDSGNGIKGAVASGAKVIAVPSQHDFEKAIFDTAMLKINSLEKLL
jgi:mannitol-1-/sugar-/sorbitol-6-/2-deoxyglucose-6-phosphatase